jgi:CPA2 family monovalent cation:H+ antiporter-2
MALTPALVAVGPRVAARLAGVLPGGSAELPPVEQSDHVVILGLGVGGQLMARALSEIAVRYLVIELNGASVHAARREGQPIIYGDATTTDTLQGAGVGQAKAVVVLLSDPDAARRAVQAARSISATVPVIVRTRYRREADQLIRQGATFAVAEELEASLEVLAQLFSRLDVPGNVTEQFLDRVRQESTGTRPLRAARTTLDSLPSGIRDAPIASHQIGEHDWAVGRTLAEIDLKARTGALVVAVRQDTGYVPSPSASLLLESGAVLYLMGDDANVVSARRLLTGGSAGG